MFCSSQFSGCGFFLFILVWGFYLVLVLGFCLIVLGFGFIFGFGFRFFFVCSWVCFWVLGVFVLFLFLI